MGLKNGETESTYDFRDISHVLNDDVKKLKVYILYVRGDVIAYHGNVASYESKECKSDFHFPLENYVIVGRRLLFFSY